MDLDQQGQTLGYYGRKGNESGDWNASETEGSRARSLLGLRRSSPLVFCVKLMAERRRKDGIFNVLTAAVKRRRGRAQTHPTESPPCWGSSYSHTPVCQTCRGAGGETTRGWKHTLTHSLQPWREGDSGHMPYLVLLGVGVIFPNPGGPCCPLSEENPLVMPSKLRGHLPEHHTWSFNRVCDPTVFPFHSQSTCYYYYYYYSVTWGI